MLDPYFEKGNYSEVSPVVKCFSKDNQELTKTLFGFMVFTKRLVTLPTVFS